MNDTKNTMAIPVAIIIAGMLIAVSVVFSNSQTVASSEGAPEARAPQTPPAPQPTGSLDALAPVTSDDHVRGSIDAPVKIVEYSDFECPFCKRFHGIMQQVMEEYGGTGQVAWVYRQFPLDSLHPVKARREALASECAAAQGGNDTFWKYTDRLFELTLTNNRTDIDTVLPQIASELGLDMTKFTSCLDSAVYADDIEREVQNAIATGGQGTPWSILVTADGTKYPINGAQPYEVVKQLIDRALQTN